MSLPGSVRPEEYPRLLQEKVDATLGLLAALSPPDPAVFASQPEAFRMRAEFRIWHEGDDSFYAMFDPAAPKTPLRIDHFAIACPRIQALMPQLRARILAAPELRRKLFQVEFLSTLAGDSLITLIYHRPLGDDWQAEAEGLAAALGVAIVGRSRKQKVVIGRDWVTETLTVENRTYHFRQYEQAFTQPNAGINRHMLAWACAGASGLSGDLLELYCGNGNFTLPLARHFGAVIATELSKTSVRAATHNLRENGVDNAHVLRLSAEEVAQALSGERRFRRLDALPRPLTDYDLRTVFVDPPRAGLDPATLQTVAGFDNVLYVSCNPLTLRDNLLALASDFRIERLGLFDQFPYTDHMECGVLLSRRDDRKTEV
jgi:tRNA (uracil-5-)-methyltransferase